MNRLQQINFNKKNKINPIKTVRRMINKKDKKKCEVKSKNYKPLSLEDGGGDNECS